MVLIVTHTYLTHEFYKDLFGDILSEYPELKKYTSERVSEMKEYYENRADYPITFLAQTKLEMLEEE